MIEGNEMNKPHSYTPRVARAVSARNLTSAAWWRSEAIKTDRSLLRRQFMLNAREAVAIARTARLNVVAS